MYPKSFHTPRPLGEGLTHLNGLKQFKEKMTGISDDDTLEQNCPPHLS
jgi:hypothetical protein